MYMNVSVIKRQAPSIARNLLDDALVSYLEKYTWSPILDQLLCND